MKFSPKILIFFGYTRTCRKDTMFLLSKIINPSRRSIMKGKTFLILLLLQCGIYEKRWLPGYWVITQIKLNMWTCFMPSLSVMDGSNLKQIESLSDWSLFSNRVVGKRRNNFVKNLLHWTFIFQTEKYFRLKLASHLFKKRLSKKRHVKMLFFTRSGYNNIKGLNYAVYWSIFQADIWRSALLWSYHYTCLLYTSPSPRD